MHFKDSLQPCSQGFSLEGERSGKTLGTRLNSLVRLNGRLVAVQCREHEFSPACKAVMAALFLPSSLVRIAKVLLHMWGLELASKVQVSSEAHRLYF